MARLVGRPTLELPCAVRPWTYCSCGSVGCSPSCCWWRVVVCSLEPTSPVLRSRRRRANVELLDLSYGKLSSCHHHASTAATGYAPLQSTYVPYLGGLHPWVRVPRRPKNYSVGRRRRRANVELLTCSPSRSSAGLEHRGDVSMTSWAPGRFGGVGESCRAANCKRWKKWLPRTVSTGVERRYSISSDPSAGFRSARSLTGTR
jgi:hypothetical protein